jgi:fructokinase
MFADDAARLAPAPVVCLGEALVDWVSLTPTLDLGRAETFVKAAGGAPANVSVGLARLGVPVSFVGGFAQDAFGPWLMATMQDAGVDLQYAQKVANANTRHAYVLTGPDGNRVLCGFTKAQCADVMLAWTPDLQQAINKAPVFYCSGPVLQAYEPSRALIQRLLRERDQANAPGLVFYDPNLRFPLWPEIDAQVPLGQHPAVEVMLQTIQQSDVVKLSDDELRLLNHSGHTNDEQATALDVFQRFGPKLLVVTMGHRGAYFVHAAGQGFVSPFQVPSVEMTGAGDGFVAGLIAGLVSRLAERPEVPPRVLLDEMTYDALHRLVYRANAVGALATTQPGAMAALPTRADLERFLALAPASIAVV